jgi:CheY-like chemotaxis protein
MHMPEMDGITLAHAIKADPAIELTRLVMLTSVGQYGTIESARLAGISAYLTKPVRQSDLHGCLTMVLNTEKQAQTPIALVRQPAPSLTSVVEALSFRQARILLTEDNKINQDVALSMLEGLGCHVDIAENGREAVEAVQRTGYDIILMDCQMPEMDGFEASRRIRTAEAQQVRPPLLPIHSAGAFTSQKRPSRTPIIALTANAMEGDRERCLAAGMDDYLSKPFTLEKLRSFLLRWLPTERTTQSALSPPEQARIAALSTQSSLTGASAPPIPASDSAVTTTAEILDQTALDQVRLLQRPGSPSILNRIITMYLAESPHLIETVQQAINANDASALMKAAHNLKSTSATLGATTLTALCKKLETLGRAQNVENAIEILPSLNMEYHAVRTALTKELEKTAA